MTTFDGKGTKTTQKTESTVGLQTVQKVTGSRHFQRRKSASCVKNWNKIKLEKFESKQKITFELECSAIKRLKVDC